MLQYIKQNIDLIKHNKFIWNIFDMSSIFQYKVTKN